MEFKFNFNVGDEACCYESSEVTPCAEDIKHVESNKIKRNISAVEHYSVADIIKHWAFKDSADIFAIDEVKIAGGDSSLYTVTPSDPDASTRLPANDLISSVYEGGFRIWECTMDLMEYLQESDAGKSMKGRTVIDIGCGIGLLGVFALKFCEAACVTFQDFNKNVILDATGPTALINFQWVPGREKQYPNALDSHVAITESCQPQDSETEVYANMLNFTDRPELAETASSKIDFIAGDWSELEKAKTKVVNHTHYDVVLSSETIYNESNYSCLHDYLNTVTKSNGVIYMSAKSHYFGVGGGVCSWIEFVKCKGIFTVNIVKDIDANLKRHILRLVRK